jgi:hypothetical protein
MKNAYFTEDTNEVLQIPEDGIYVVKGGTLEKLDLFSWGYEGIVPAEIRFVKEMSTGKLILGAGDDETHNR